MDDNILLSHLRQSQHIVKHFESLENKKLDTEHLGEPLSTAFPKIDFFLSIQSIASGKDIESMIVERFTGGLEKFLLKCLQYGYLGRFGATVMPSNYLLNFPSSHISLLWIPKNSCTTLKRVFLAREPSEATSKILRHQFHETCQDHFGVTTPQFVHDKILPMVCVFRNPYERIVSCYLDKFAKPILTDSPFEKFIRGHILAAQTFLNIQEDQQRSISFSEFVRYIHGRPRWSLDAHWRPQHNFLPSEISTVRFGKVDSLSSFFSNLGIEYSNVASNTSFGGQVFGKQTGKFANLLPHELSNRDLKDYGHFISSDSHFLLRQMLEDDLEIYNAI